MKILKPYKVFRDKRGILTGIINHGKWEEVNYIETAKKSVRGKHYHKKTLELFYILEGSIDILVKNLKNGKTKKILVKAGSILLIEPFEIHTFIPRERSRWINILSKKIDDTNPDIIYKY